MSKPTEDEIKAMLVRASARGFSSGMADLPDGYEMSCRDNGDVGEEMPGREDILAARRIRAEAKKTWPDVKVEGEVVDEWVSVTLTFP